MKKLLLVMTVLSLGLSAKAQNTNRLLEHYLQVKDALVNSNNKAAAASGATLHQAVKNEENFAQKAGLLKATEKLDKAGTIEQQRAALQEVSTIMWNLVKASETIEQPVYYQYCPMKKTNWLSTEKDIKNPYYGAAMLTCGKVVETNQ